MRENQILNIIRESKVRIEKEDLDLLVYELYKHIDYTRREAFHNGYKQGKFDQQIGGEWDGQKGKGRLIPERIR